MNNNVNNKITIRPIGLMRRMMIMFYDAMLLVAVLFFASIPVAVAFQITPEHPLYPLYIIYIYLVGFVFFGWCWTHGGQTLGLKTWKIRLIADSGEKISWRAALLRYLGSMLCWLSCGIGFIWCYTNKERLAWNDIISKTRLRKL